MPKYVPLSIHKRRCELYEAGWSTREVGNMLGCSQGSVRDSVVFYGHIWGVVIRTHLKSSGSADNRIKESEIHACVKLYLEEEMSMEEIAKKLGFKHGQYVGRRIRAAGIPIRTRSEALRLRYRKHGHHNNLVKANVWAGKHRKRSPQGHFIKAEN